MKIRNKAVSGLAGAGISIVIGLLVRHLGSEGGFWSGLYDLVVLPAVYLHALLLGLFFGTIEGSPTVFSVFFVIYLGSLGFFIGAFLNRLRIRWKKRQATCDDE